MSTVHLSARAPTDIWRKPPNLNVSSAPTNLRSLSSPQFHRARVTISASWTRLYDQGGLFILFPEKNAETDNTKRFWLKTGIEYYNGQANLSTVSAREWADWSLLPLKGDTVTVEIERERPDLDTGKGSSLWVYMVEGDKRIAVREVTWAFEQEGEIEVGIYAARPTVVDGEPGDELLVKFESLNID